MLNIVHVGVCGSYCGAYTMDVIASTAFGIEIDSHNDPSNQFVQNSKEIFKFRLSVRVIILRMCYSFVFIRITQYLQHFDTVGWASGRASSQQKFE